VKELKAFLKKKGDSEQFIEKAEMVKRASELRMRGGDPLEEYMEGLQEDQAKAGERQPVEVRADIDEDEDDIEGTIRHIIEQNEAVQRAQQEAAEDAAEASVKVMQQLIPQKMHALY